MAPKKIIIPGFQFAGIHCGIKDDPRKKDLTLIYSEELETLIDGVFTKNRVCAAPVEVCRKSIRQGKGRLVVVNSGIANACTGVQGLRDAKKTQKEAARLFKLNPDSVMVCSTGKIGDPLPIRRLLRGLKKGKRALSGKNFLEAAKGIMTTDQFVKFGVARGRIKGKKYIIAVMTKGAGMLRPDMATMLTFIVTNLKFSRPVLSVLFRRAVDLTLNRVTVDGDMSTNDTVLILANGRAGNKPFGLMSPEAKIVETQLTALLTEMAKKITLDGEGATKCCRVQVSGAQNRADAKKVAYAVGNSPLVKTALFGCDPNWGRIMAAVGYSGASVIPEKISIHIGPYLVVRKGQKALGHDPLVVSKYMRKKNIDMRIDLGLKSGNFHIYMSDLTYDYVHLNAEYHT
ncbi:MAG: bifunctional glutamate N-acetyltransferase/amino-acid acetyltransferase ArgJ [Deltaproteobacteria bacterium]|nr:bifunctional glutamate N-acetyltransferase/amino-acid acetyltransferase ArgJ [Deltaproteobacteria bacterium]